MHQFGGYLFHNAEEMEITLGRWLQMQEPDFYCGRIFKLMPI
jgi:hypothetical protein